MPPAWRSSRRLGGRGLLKPVEQQQVKQIEWTSAAAAVVAAAAAAAGGGGGGGGGGDTGDDGPRLRAGYEDEFEGMATKPSRRHHNADSEEASDGRQERVLSQNGYGRGYSSDSNSSANSNGKNMIMGGRERRRGSAYRRRASDGGRSDERSGMNPSRHEFYDIGDISTISHYHMCISEKSKNIMCWFSKSRSCFLNNFDFVHEAARRTCAASYVRASVRHPLI